VSNDGNFRVYSEYSIDQCHEVWEGEIDSEDLREIYSEGFGLAHTCVLESPDPAYGDDTYSYIFIHKSFAGASAHCDLCGWTQGAGTGDDSTRERLKILVPKGIPHFYATYREDAIRDLFKSFDNDFDFDDADFD
jgi:hypothetical protein